MPKLSDPKLSDLKLSDTQAILLSAASRRDDRSLYPLPAAQARGGGVAKSIAALVRAGFAQEHETSVAAAVARADGGSRYGLFATAAGLAAIGVVSEVAEKQPSPAAPPAAGAPRQTKTAQVLALLERDRGATLSELIQATGWLPHTTRAALTGLRKQGHAVERGKRDGTTCYRIEAAR